MKKTLALLILTSLILCSISSCQVAQSVTDDSTTAETTGEPSQSKYKIYDELKVYTSGLVEAGQEQSHSEHDIYNPRSFGRVWEEEGVENRTVTINGITDTYEYDRTIQGAGLDYGVDIFASVNRKEQNFRICYKHGTDQIVMISSYYQAAPIMTSETSLETEDDYIAFARTIADDYMDLEGCTLYIEHVTEEDSTVSNYDQGNTYTFLKTLFGIPTSESVSVSINHKGEVKEIYHKSIDQFEDFQDLEIDMEKLYAKVNEIANGRKYAEGFCNDSGLLYLSFAIENGYSYIIPIAEVIDEDQETTEDPSASTSVSTEALPETGSPDQIVID